MQPLFGMVRRYWHNCSLRSRILLPIVVLMLLSIFASAVAFVFGTTRTERAMLDNQLQSDSWRVEGALLDKAGSVETSAALLSNDPQLKTALAAGELTQVNQRAVVIRDRFFLDLVQVFDGAKREQANLVTADLYRVSSMEDRVGVGGLEVELVGDRMLLLRRHDLPDNEGAVITGVDLQSELRRIVSQERLPGDVTLYSDWAGVSITSDPVEPPGQSPGDATSSHSRTILLGDTPLTLRVTRPTTDNRRVTQAGLTVMVGSSLVTTLLLSLLGVFITRSITVPVQRLASAAQAVAGGEWSQQRELTGLAAGRSGDWQTRDEIRLMAQAFDLMVTELRLLTSDLEKQVAQRTRWLLTAADVANAASSSLDLDVVLATSVTRIHSSFGFSLVSIHVVEPDTQTLGLKEVLGEGASQSRCIEAKLDPMYANVVASAARLKAPVVIRGVPDTGHGCPPDGLPTGPEEAAIPMIRGDRLVGVLGAKSGQPGAFTEETLGALRAIADQLAVAIENARLYDAAQKEVEERRRADVARRASEERYRLLFEEDLTGDFISMADGTVVACNPTFSRMFGFSTVSDARECRLPALFGSSGEWEDLMALVRRNGRLEYYETEMRAADGRAVNVVANLIGTQNEDGDLVELKGYLFDNTDRKHLEEQFRHAQKMEAIGRLAGGVAHDFNNLLTVVIGYSELLSMRSDIPDIASRQIQTIHQTGQRAAALTRHLLAFSRKQVLQPSVLDLNAVVSNMDTMIRRLVGEDVCLSLCLDQSVGLVKADVSQIEQVVMNLVVNARDAMPSGGRLLIETSNVDLDTSYAQNHVDVVAGAYVMLAVTDTGSGIPADVLPYIFEPFYTTKEMGRGTGLGLSTVYGILKQSGGHVHVYSEVGRGTTFKLYLPRTDEAAPAESHYVPMGSAVNGRETLMLVEDELDVREMAAGALRSRGYRVLEAANGAEALAVAETHGDEIRLVITDVIMPGMTGKEVADRLAIKIPHLRVLFVSGYSEHAIAQHGILSPGATFLSKPFSPDALAHRVRTLLDADHVGVFPPGEVLATAL